MRFLKFLLIALIVLAGNVCPAQVPERPDSMMPIIDMAGIIKNDSLVNALNTRLDSLSRRTTNQIVVVTVNDLGNLEANQFATELGKKWGIGDKKSNNGLIILLKPRNDKGPGDVYVAPGRGLQGALPDVKCRYITDSIMVPHLKEGDYASGIDAAINYIEPIVIEEYEQAQAAASQGDNKKGGGNGWWILGGIAAAIGGLAFLRKRNKKNQPQQPADGDDNNASMATSATAGAASALAATPQEEPQEEEKEPQEEEEDNNDEIKPNEPEPYKYKYGGGTFDGAGAGSKF